MKKKLTALFLAVVMCMTMSAPAFAADIAATDAAELEAVIQAEIKAEEARIFNDIHEQLVEQDAEDLMSIFMENLAPKIESNVRAQYSDNVAVPMEEVDYVFRNGGTIGYVSSLGATVLDTYMTDDQFREYIIDDLIGSLATGTVEVKLDIIMDALGINLGVWGTIFSVLGAAEYLVKVNSALMIHEASGYANLIEVSTATDGAAGLVEWENHPIAPNPPRGSTNIHAANHGY